MKQYLAITLLSKERPASPCQLTEIISSVGCQITASRMSLLGSSSVFSVLVQGSWDLLAKLETQLEHLNKTEDCEIIHWRTETKKPESNLLPYTVELIAPEKADLIDAIVQFFTEQSLEIIELYTQTYEGLTGASMLNLILRLFVPTDYAISALREDLQELCENLNIDATIEPDRPPILRY